MQVRFAARLRQGHRLPLPDQWDSDRRPLPRSGFGVGSGPPTMASAVSSATGRSSRPARSRDFVVLGDEVKKVDEVFGVPRSRRRPPRRRLEARPAPIDVDSGLAKMVDGDTNCWSDGNCRSATRSTTRRPARQRLQPLPAYTATLAFRAPVLAPSITGTLHRQTVRLGQTCHPSGNCGAPSRRRGCSARRAAQLRDPRLRPQWRRRRRRRRLAVLRSDRHPQHPRGRIDTFTRTFFDPGLSTVKIIAFDDEGKSTEIDTTLTIRKVDQGIVDTDQGGAVRRAVRHQVTLNPPRAGLADEHGFGDSDRLPQQVTAGRRLRSSAWAPAGSTCRAERLSAAPSRDVRRTVCGRSRRSP